MAIGGLTLDRPVRLSGPLTAGARLRGASLGAGLRGRLGAAAANAAAWAKAGHQAFVAEGDEGDEGEACSRPRDAPVWTFPWCPADSRGGSGRTLIQIEPGGERVVLDLDGPDPAGVGPLPPLPTPGDYPGLELEGQASRARSAWETKSRAATLIR